MSAARNRRPNRRIVIACLALVAAMTGLAYAAVPLYDLFCRVTGFGGTTQVAVQAPGVDEVRDRHVKVRFDANVAPGLNWSFEPEARVIETRAGETEVTAYLVKNLSGEATRGHATYNVQPAKAGIYFQKVACFCFQDQPLGPGEGRAMPVNFFIDPAFADDPDMADVDEITLSYTFFPPTEALPATADASAPNR